MRIRNAECCCVIHVYDIYDMICYIYRASGVRTGGVRTGGASNRTR